MSNCWCNCDACQRGNHCGGTLCAPREKPTEE